MKDVLFNNWNDESWNEKFCKIVISEYIHLSVQRLWKSCINATTYFELKTPMPGPKSWKLIMREFDGVQKR